jgi:hypothetical protein
MNKEKLIVIQDYPATFAFTTNETLTDFNEETGCSLRNRILFDELKRQEIDSRHHSYGDYVVEIVDTSMLGDIEIELWTLGS